MKHLFILCSAVIACQFCIAQNGFPYQVKGNIAGLKNDSVILVTRTYDKSGAVKENIKVAVAKNNKFSFNGHSDALQDASIRVGGFNARKSFSLFIEKGTIYVNGHVDSLDYCSVTGTPGNDEYTANKKEEEIIYAAIRQLQTQLKQAATNKDAVARVTNETIVLRDSIKSRRIHFISTHHNSPASAVYLYVLQDHITAEQLENYYTNLAPAIKNLSYLRKIPGKIRARKNTAIGNMAPDFSATDIDGKPFSLSAYRGKYVLLEFWASWCVPCRAENPELLKAYNTYKEKGFVVIGISLDDKKDKWEKAIREDQLSWVHTSELNAFDNKVALLYGVQPIPDNFLIDPQGKIIARKLSGKEVAEKLGHFIK